MKPRVLFVSRRVELPLAPSLERKWDAIGAELDYRVLAAGDGVNGAFHLARELPRVRRARVLRGAAGADRAPATRVPPRRRACAGGARDRGRALGPQAGARRHGRDCRPAR